MSDAAAAPAPGWDKFRRLEFSKGGDPPTRLFSQRLGACIAYAALRLGLTPSQVTLAGAILGLGTSAAYAVAPQGLASMVSLALAYQLAYGFDCADGQLARALRRTSEFGAWFDVAVDYVRYIAMGYAVIVLLVTQHGFALFPALWVGGAFTAGTVVSLHTSVSLQRQAAEKNVPRGESSALRNLMRTMIDTPVLVLMLAALRDAPHLLALYVGLMGIGYLLLSLALALRRFSARST